MYHFYLPSKCWLGNVDKNVSIFNLQNYKIIFQPKSCCAHGGLINYAQFYCIVMSELKVHLFDQDYMCLKTLHHKPESLIYVLSIFTVLRVKSNVLRVKSSVLRVKPIVIRVKPIVLRVKRENCYILIHFLRVK